MKYNNDDENLTGYLPVYDINTKTKGGTIKALSSLLGNEIATQLYNHLPINLWANHKHWVSYSIIQNEIINVMMKNKYKIHKFNNDDLETILQRYNKAIQLLGIDDGSIKEIFPYYSLTDDDDFLREYLNNLTLVIAQHVNARWEDINKRALSIRKEDLFPIPGIISPFLPLFAGVKINKISLGEDEYPKCYLFNEVNDYFIIEISVSDDKFVLQIKKSAIKEYYYNLKKNIYLMLLDKAFSPKGLLYLLAIFLSIEENGRNGSIDESMTDFFKRIKTGQIKKEQIEDLIDILFVFGNIQIKHLPKSANGRGRFIKFFDYYGDLKKTDIRTFRIKLKSWRNTYDSYIQNHNFTILPKQIIREPLSNNALKFFILTFLSFYHWLNNEDDIKISIKDFISICALDTYGNPDGYDKKQIKRLEKDIEYLKIRGYIGEWCSDRTNQENSIDLLFEKPSQYVLQNTWKEYSIIITKPIWIYTTTGIYGDRRKIFLDYPLKRKITGSEIIDLRRRDRLTQNKLAEILHLSRQTISQIESNRKKPSSKIARKLIELISLKNDELS